MIQVKSYTTPLTGGQEGQVVAQAGGPSAVTKLTISITSPPPNDGNAPQVIGEITGPELRWVRAIGFATPHTPGNFNLFLTAVDARGCKVSTTAQRTLVIQ